MSNPIIYIGILLGVASCLDLFYSKKRSGAFIRFLIYILTIAIPTIYKATNSSINDNSSYKYEMIYPSLFITIFIFTLIVYYTTYLKIKREYQTNDNLKLIYFFDLLYSGYDGFIEKIKYSIIDTEKTHSSNYEILLKENHSLRKSTLEFISQIYMALDYPELKENQNEYALYVLVKFVNNYIGKNNARFTLRKICDDQKYMKAIVSTKLNEMPGDINISKKNLISKSYELGKPLIYSENKKYHFTTSNNSIKRGNYDDYVTYCIHGENKKPIYSLCLDVKGEDARKRMKALVDSLIFDVICNAIRIKMINPIENE